MTDQTPVSDLTSDDKLWALLSWILAPIVPVIVLLMEDKKSRPFIKYNAVMGLIWSLVYIIIGGILTAVVIGPCVMGLGWLATLYWGIKSYQGTTVKIPFLSDFVKNQGWA
jgi:uncharacterized protein